MKIFVTGGTGLVGRRLVRALRKRKDEAVVLSRRAGSAREALGDDCKIIEGDPMQPGSWQDGVAECDAVVHLAGENLFARRWNDEFKALLRESRVKSTEHVVAALARQPKKEDGSAKTLVNASAIGYYGPHGDEELDEGSSHGADTLARMCIDWERAAQGVEEHGVRLALIRFGVVLDKEGGALAQLLLPFKMCVGGKVASGTQYMSWIHHQDLIGIILLALDHPEAKGPINGTAPNPVINKEFSKALGAALGRPSFMPTPGFALRLMLGEVAEIITSGQRVLPRRALELGYSFKFPEVGGALRDILQ